LGANYLPGFAVDQNNGTEWKATNTTYPQWLQVDLGTNRVIGSIATAFEYFTEYYQYTTQYSTNAVNWFTYADRSTNTQWGSPLVDSNSVTARYFKLNLIYSSKTNQSPGVWEFKVYPPGSAALAPVGVTATGGLNQVALRWTASAGAAAYCVQRAVFSGGPYLMVGYGVTTNNFIDTGLNNGKTYYYVVSAIDTTGAVGAVSTEVNATPAIPTIPATLVHRYSFNERSGTNCADSIGGATWNGTLPNGGTFGGGKVTLADSSKQYVQLSAGILSNYAEVTIEAWATFPSQLPANCFFFGFGNISGVDGANYIFCAPQGGRIAITATNPGYNGEQNAYGNFDFSFHANLHVVAVFNPPAESIALYTNGVLAGINNSVTNSLASVNDVYSLIGKSLYSGDPYPNFTLDEFRIYYGVLTTNEIAATQVLGPDQLLATNSPSATATSTGGSLMLAWPLASAGFKLQSRTNLVLGDWTDVTSPVPQIVGSQWQVTVPITGGEQFFRLLK
jgi:hypothetical protein